MSVLKNFIKKIDIFYKREKNEVKMGDGCIILDNVKFGSEPYLIELGNNVKVSSDVQFIPHDGGVHVLRNLGYLRNADKFGRIIVGDNVFIGLGSIIMPSVSIGNNVIIGAGSIVTKDIPDNSVACGVPAKVICTIEDYYRKNITLIDNTKDLSAKEKKEYLIKKYKL